MDISISDDNRLCVKRDLLVSCFCLRWVFIPENISRTQQNQGVAGSNFALDVLLLHFKLLLDDGGMEFGMGLGLLSDLYMLKRYG